MGEIFLIRKAKKGDKEATIQLIMKEKDSFYRLAYSYMKNEEDAMDALQDMIIKIYENIGGLKKDKSFYSWSKTILVNICKDKLKSKKSIISLDTELVEVKNIELNMEEAMVLEDLFLKIKPIYRDVINLRFILGYDYESISEILEIPLGTVKSRLYNGKVELERVLREENIYAG